MNKIINSMFFLNCGTNRRHFMVKVAVLNFDDPEKWNRWIVGTPSEVPKSSPFYSEQLQMAYVNNPDRREFLKRQVEHYHIPPIEEYYLVLQGTLKVRVENRVIVLKPMQLLAVPPNKRHTIIDYSSPLQYFVIRAPISSEKTKIKTKQ
jgi:mannose-6-phosphate isomerase-like protein (cupin superfamily)